MWCRRVIGRVDVGDGPAGINRGELYCTISMGNGAQPHREPTEKQRKVAAAQ